MYMNRRPAEMENEWEKLILESENESLKEQSVLP